MRKKIKKVSLTVYVREDEEGQLISDLKSTVCNNEAMLWGGSIDSIDMDPTGPEAEAIASFMYQFDGDDDDDA